MRVKDISDLIVRETAELCRATYIRERTNFATLRPGSSKNKKVRAYTPHPKWDGGEDANGHQHKPYWPKMARFMLEHELDPEYCIHMQFGDRKRTDDPPFPSHITSVNWLDRYQVESPEVLISEVKDALQTEKAHCMWAIALIEDDDDAQGPELWREVLFDDTIPMSPLFRYCVAYRDKLHDVANEYEQSAMVQYSLARKAYEEGWKGWIPEDFKDSVQMACQIIAKARR